MAYVDSSGKTHVSLSEAAGGHAAQTTASRNAAGQIVGSSSGSNYAREEEQKIRDTIQYNTGMPSWATAPGETAGIDRSQLQQFKTIDQLEAEKNNSKYSKAVSTYTKGYAAGKSDDFSLDDLKDLASSKGWGFEGAIAGKIVSAGEDVIGADRLKAYSTGYALGRGKEADINSLQAPKQGKDEMISAPLYEWTNKGIDSYSSLRDKAVKPIPEGTAKDVIVGVSDIPGWLAGTIGGAPLGVETILRNPTSVSDSIGIGLGLMAGEMVTTAEKSPGRLAGQLIGGYSLGKVGGKFEANIKQKRQASKLPASELSEVPLKELTPSTAPKLRELTLKETPDGIVVKEYASAADLQATKAHAEAIRAKPRKPETPAAAPKLKELTLEETPDGIIVKEYASAADLQATKAHSKALRNKPRKQEPAPTTPKLRELTLEETSDGIVVKEYASAADLQATKTRTESLQAKRLKQRKQNHERAPTTPKLQELTLEETPDGIVVKEYASAADLQATKAHSKALRNKPRKQETPSAAPKLRELTLEETPDGIVVKEYASVADLQATKAHAQVLRAKRINSLRSGPESTSRGSLKTLKRSVSTKGLKEFSLNEKASLFPEFPKVSESPSFPELSTYSGSKPRYNRENPLRQIQIEKQAAKRSALLKMEYKQPRALDVLEDVRGPSHLKSDLLPNILRADGSQKGVYAPAFSYSLPFIGQGFLPNLNPQKEKERSLFTASVLPDISSNILDVSSNILDVSSRVNEKNSEKNDNILFLPTLPEISLTDTTIQKDITIQDAIQNQIPVEIFDIPELTATSGGFDPRLPYIPKTKKPPVFLDDSLDFSLLMDNPNKRRKTKQKTIKNTYGDPFKIKL